MAHVAHRPGITFAVDDVKPATEPLYEKRTHEVLRSELGGIEGCSDYHGSVVRHRRVQYQPLLASVYVAFCEHRPLVLTPDAVWITIAQGVAHHMAIHGERLRPRFVAHEGKLDLAFESRGWVEGSPENPWAEAFDGWSEQIRNNVGERLHDLLVCDFGTSGPIERAASQVVMMDVFRRYFHYVMVGICGIPTVTLEGSSEDWKRLRDKAAGLEVFDLGWWLPHLLPICDQFVRASRGDVDLDHWRGICKLREAYGGGIVNGWIARLFPYLRAFLDGPCSQRNPIFETGEGFQTFLAPSGLSRVPFKWRTEKGHKRPMEAIGGLVGVAQDPDTLALRAKVGWAIREADRLEVLLSRLDSEHSTFPGGGIEGRTYLPADLAAFYHRTDGAILFGGSEPLACRIVPHGEMQPLDWGEDMQSSLIRISRGPGDRIWHRFAELLGGEWLAINLDINRRDPDRQRGDEGPPRRLFSPICRVREETRGKPGENPVVALSFTELLGRMLDQGDTPYWLAPGFADYGDAETFTRRDKV